MNNLPLFIFSCFLLLIGLLCLAKPIKVIKILYLWPKLIFKLLPDEMIPEAAKNALSLIYYDESKYSQRFPVVVGIFRVSGVIALFMFVVSLCMYNK